MKVHLSAPQMIANLSDEAQDHVGLLGIAK